MKNKRKQDKENVAACFYSCPYERAYFRTTRCLETCSPCAVFTFTSKKESLRTDDPPRVVVLLRAIVWLFICPGKTARRREKSFRCSVYRIRSNAVHRSDRRMARIVCSLRKRTASWHGGKQSQRQGNKCDRMN